MLSSVSLRVKILSTSFVTTAFMLAVGLIGLSALKSVSDKYEHIADINLSKTQVLAYMRGSAKDITRNVIRLSLPGNSKEEINHVVEKIGKLRSIYETSRSKYLALTFDEGEKELAEILSKAEVEFFSRGEKAVQLAKGETAAEKEQALYYLNKEYRDVYDDLLFPALNKLVDYQEARSRYWIGYARETTKKANLFSGLSIVAGILLSLAFGMAFSTSLSKALLLIATELNVAANEVAATSNQMSSSSSSLSNCATEQSSAIQETAASVEEMTAMLKKTSENAVQSESLSNESSDKAEQGRQAITQMTQAIDEIKKSNHEITSEMERSNLEFSGIVKLIAEIEEKTKVINDIVFQTKLLSFNASVEAARAGEHGKGFAVVAEEVGNLAAMSGKAAQEISQMLEGSIEKVRTIVESTQGRVEHLVQDGRKKIEIGQVTAQVCNETLEALFKNVTSIRQRVAEISVASREQTHGVEGINQAMIQLNEVTQQNAQTSNETASAAKTLTHHAHGLSEMVRHLDSLIRGGRAVEVAAAASANDHAIFPPGGTVSQRELLKAS